MFCFLILQFSSLILGGSSKIFLAMQSRFLRLNMLIVYHYYFFLLANQCFINFISWGWNMNVYIFVSPQAVMIFF